MPYNSINWVECSKIYVNSDNPVFPAIENTAGYINTVTGYGPYINTWMEVDVTSYGVPQDATAIFLSGRLIITQGLFQQSPNMTVLYAAPSSDIPSTMYQIQAISNSSQGGERQDFSTWVPLENGKFKMLWNTPGNLDPWVFRYPNYASYGLNTSIQAYAK